MEVEEIKNKSSQEFQAIACLQGILSKQGPTPSVHGLSLPTKSQMYLGQWIQVYFALQRRKRIEREFSRLSAEWKSTRRSTSFARDWVSLPAYLEIIGIGPDAMPLILKELETELDHWFVALKSISGEDPVPAASKGNMNEMRNAWLKWGHDKGYTW